MTNQNANKKFMKQDIQYQYPFMINYILITSY